jgi:3-hydroxyisobutyrate dehydrogenase-like beta-hydroxyacid dehydrogenase
VRACLCRGQVTKLLVNAMTMSNLDNAVGLIRLVSRLGMNVHAVIDVIDVSSGGSAILRALSSDVTPEIAPHIQGLMSKDIEHFADAIRAYGLDPQPQEACAGDQRRLAREFGCHCGLLFLGAGGLRRRAATVRSEKSRSSSRTACG